MPLSPSDTRDQLARLGHHPKRHLGQNFLVDGNIVQKSLALAEVCADDTVVEIGPGLGTLTRALLETGASVWAVEMDPTLHAHLAETLVPAFSAQLHLRQGDALDHPLAGLPAERAAAAFKIVANLPYAISTPWMDAVLDGPLPARLVLMLQQEAAQRYAAQPGSKLFGAISIFLQSAYTIAPGHKVAAACFHPRPEIESYLFHLIRRCQPFHFAPAVHQLIRVCFQQRRKQLGSLLRERLPDGGAAWFSHFSAYGLDARARPEQVPVALWQRLSVPEKTKT